MKETPNARKTHILKNATLQALRGRDRISQRKRPAQTYAEHKLRATTNHKNKHQANRYPERRFRNRVLHVKVRDMARTQIDSLINGARRTSTSSTKKK